VFASTGARDAAITSPVAGQICYVASANSAEGLYTYNGTAWRQGPGWNAPWGVVGQASSTSAQTGIGAGLTDVTFATVTWTGVSNRLYRVFSYMLTQQVTSSGVQQFQIQTGSSGAGTAITNQLTESITAGTNRGIQIFGTYFTGTGSQSLHMRASTTVGTLTIDNATAKGWFVVEDVGPTGNPA
jgi:hypothetical protein